MTAPGPTARASHERPGVASAHQAAAPSALALPLPDAHDIDHINITWLIGEAKNAASFHTAASRRTFLKRTSAMAALGLTTSLTPDLAFGQARTDLKGVTIDYWNQIGVQNKTIRKISEQIIQAFEQRTGAKVNVTWNSYGDIIGPKYRTNFKGGIKPTVFDTSGRWVNQLREFLLPLDDMINSDLDAETRDGIAWLFPLFKEQNRGFKDAATTYAMPFNVLSQAAYLMNREHVEKAGLKFDENYPIRDSDHYIEICKTIKEKVGIQYPTEVYGKIWDYGDTQLPGWIRSFSIAGQRLPQRGLDQEQRPLGRVGRGHAVLRRRLQEVRAELAQYAAEHR